MRLHTACLLLLLGGLTLSLTYAQGPTPLAPVAAPRPIAPAELIRPVSALTPMPPTSPQAVPPSQPATLSRPGADLSQLPLIQRHMHLTALSGAEWLADMNTYQGRFLYGWVPALKVPLEGNHYLHQAGAAFALARAARFAGTERYVALASQTVLSLLLETEIDPADKQVRSTTLPSIVTNRLGAAALLVLAINELPAPQKDQPDLLEKSEQLCNFIRKQARPDGSLCCCDLMPDGKPGFEEPDAALTYPGQALYALMRSQRLQPAAWKIELLRKALAYYAPWWRRNKTMAFVGWQSAAYAEAYLVTKEQAFADFVFEMNDWLCGLQYRELDPMQKLWLGGFKSWQDGKPVEVPPRIESAGCAESLAHACRVARAVPDSGRHQRYTDALERSLQFLSTLQYTEGNTLHFEESYRKRVVGGFHASHQDGNLRIDYAQSALSALVLYLEDAGR